MKQVLLVLAMAASAPATPGQTMPSSCFVEQAKLAASDGVAGDFFGDDVAVFGDRALVGATGDDPDGSVYVLRRNGTIWTEEAKLTAIDTGEPNILGSAVSLAADRAVVGSPGSIDAEGEAFVFLRSGTTWAQEAQLTASDGAGLNAFGGSVSLDGDRVLVGAWGSDAAYVYVRSGTSWIEEAKLTASDGTAGDRFGRTVSLSGDRALVGASYDDDNGTNSGSAYLFVRSGTSWTEEAQLTDSDGEANDHFGSGVSLSGDTALVGASGLFVDPVEGKAFVFVRSGTTWTEEAELTASDGALQDLFGGSVYLSGDTALVTASGDDHAAGSGSAYVFVRSGTLWTEEGKLTASDGGDGFGLSLSLSGGTVLMGAKYDDENATNAGSAYVFTLPEPSVYCTAGVSAAGCQASIGHAGVPSASATSGFSLVATGVEGSKDGLFFFGTNGRQANSWGNGTSFQCVAPPVMRGGLLTGSGTTGLCDGAFSQDLNALWCPSCPKPQKNPGACATVQAQLWYRDPGSTSNQPTSFSDALEFVVSP